MTGTRQGYSFSNASPHAADHLQALAKLLDPGTTQLLKSLVDLSGKNCLEVAAGGGSIARWLAAMVGEQGRVTAIDLDVSHIAPHPRLTILEHDITKGDPPGGPFDVIHVRLLLNHLPQRRQVLHRLAGLLAPGGLLVVEEWHPQTPSRMVAHAANTADKAVYMYFQDALLAVLAAHGNDRFWSMEALHAFIEEGLVDVDAQMTARAWRGGGPGCRLQQASLQQLRDELLAHDLTPEQLDHVHQLLDDPQFVLFGHLLYATWGWRAPAEPAA
jgi:2-polyprenyl-3-methyl-5-hydroxy-6-metoxy-1,4-benzoquinol methylase